MDIFRNPLVKNTQKKTTKLTRMQSTKMTKQLKKKTRQWKISRNRRKPTDSKMKKTAKLPTTTSSMMAVKATLTRESKRAKMRTNARKKMFQRALRRPLMTRRPSTSKTTKWTNTETSTKRMMKLQTNKISITLTDVLKLVRS